MRTISRPCGLAIAISLALGFTVPVQSWAAQPVDSNIDASTDSLRKTVTTINKTGAPSAWIFDITSATHKNGTEFNSFSHFQLQHGDTVNFNLSNGNKNVVNLVWDSRAYINGAVNSYIGSGANKTIGGNVFFADAHGIVVGSDAILNVGSLSLSAPSEGFMNSLLGAGGLNTDANNIQALLEGREQLTSTTSGVDCMICVSGVINATNAVRIRATTIDVDGKIATTGLGDSILGTAVNVTDPASGNTTLQVVNDGNTIRLVAEDAMNSDAAFAKANTAVNIKGSASLSTANNARANTSTASADSWGDIEAIATSVAHSDYGTPMLTAPATQDIGNLWRDQEDFALNGLAAATANVNLLTAEKGMQAAFVVAEAKAKVSMDGAISASGDVTLASSTQTSATTDATTSAFKSSAPQPPLAVTVMYGGMDSRANTSVGSSASIAGKNVAVTANTDNTMEISGSTRVGKNATQAIATTVSISQANVSASATVAGQVSADGLSIDAQNANSFTTQAATYSDDGKTPVGVAAAIALHTVNAQASLNNNASNLANTFGDGGVSVTAASNTSANVTEASTMVTPLWMQIQEPSTSKAPVASGTNLTGSLTKATGSGGKGLGAALPFKLAGALSFTDSTHKAHADIGANVQINSDGNAVVQGVVKDEGIHGGANSAATASSQSGSAAPVVISAAVNYGNYAHDAAAVIGANARITAANIGVGSSVELPFDWTFGFSQVADMGKSFDAFMDGAKQMASVVSPLGNPLVKNAIGFAGASTPTKDAQGNTVEPEVGIAGMVNYLEFKNDSRAWVDQGAQLTATSALATTAAAEKWTQTLADGTETTWDKSITVRALADNGIFSLVGEVRPWALVGGGGGVAAGGGFNYTGLKNSAIAGVASDASLVSDNNDVLIDAKSATTLFALSPVGGKGSDAALEGTVSVSDVDDTTHATLSGSADVSARALKVQAQNPLTAWSLSGAIAMSNQTSIGISVGVNSVSTDTVAKIGDNHADGSDPANTSGAQSGGTIAVNDLSVNATTTGEVGGVSLAGSVRTPDSGGGGGASAPQGGGGIVKLFKKITGVIGTMQTVVAGVDSMKQLASPDDPQSTDESLLDKANTFLSQASDGVAKAGALADKVSNFGSKTKQATTKPGAGPQKKAGFGIQISGAASVNISNLNTTALVDGVTINNGATGTRVTVQAINRANQVSAAGAAALNLKAGGSGSGGSNASVGGAVAYSKIADSTKARIEDSTLVNTPQVAVRALDGSLQIALGVGASVSTSTSGGQTTIAGSVSIAQSRNTTEAGIERSQVDGGSFSGNGSDPRVLEVVAYDHTRIGTGAGAFSFNAGGNGNSAALGLTWSDISNSTKAVLGGHVASGSAADLKNFGAFGVQALDSSLIGTGAFSGTASSGTGNSLSGAFIWNSVKNNSQVVIGDGVRIDLPKGMSVRAAAVQSGVDPTATALNQLIGSPGSSYNYDFAASSLTYTGSSSHDTGGDTDQPNAASLNAAGWGSSIIAVAGVVSVGGNNVGLSFVGSEVSNKHEIAVGNAVLSLAGDLSLIAQDNTRIISLAVGAGVSSGKFAGTGSVTYNEIDNSNAISFGDGLNAAQRAAVSAKNIYATSSDKSHIYSLAGNVAIGAGSAAAGGAVTYNKIGNDNTVKVDRASLTTTDSIQLTATQDAKIMSAAVAGAVAANTGLAMSFGWNETESAARVSSSANSVLSGKALKASADDNASIYTLSGSVGVGGNAGVGAAGSVADIGDTAQVSLVDSTVDVSDSIALASKGTGTVHSLAVGVAAGGDGAASGSFTFSTINKTVEASASGLKGSTPADNSNPNAAVRTKALSVKADSTAKINSLATSLAGGAYGSGSLAIVVADIGGTTRASLSNSVLGVSDTTDVIAKDLAHIRTLSVGGSVGAGTGSGSNSTNLIHNSISAGMTNIGTDAATDGRQLDTADTPASQFTRPDGTIEYTPAQYGLRGTVSSANVTTVQASNQATIESMAGAIGIGGGAFGAAIAVNRISTTNDAYFSGSTTVNREYRVRGLNVRAAAENTATDASDSNIKTIAVSGTYAPGMSLAGSVAVNVMSAKNTARIDSGANVIAEHDVGVLAGNDQGIDVFAGALSAGGTAVGVGIVVNYVEGETRARIDGASVTAYGRGSAGLSVDNGTAAQGVALDDAIDLRGKTMSTLFDSQSGAGPSGRIAPDLSGTQTVVHGVAVNAVNTQHIATLGVGASYGQTAVSGQIAANVIGGTTSASINNSNINQANIDSNGIYHGPLARSQQVDLRASSRQHEFSRVFEVSVGTGGALGAGVVANVFNANTDANITNSTVNSILGTRVLADTDQWSLAGTAGLSASANTAGTGSVGINVFKSATHAFVDSSDLKVGQLDVNADTDAASSLVGGAIGIGVMNVGLAGVGLVNVNQSETQASIKNGSNIQAATVRAASTVGANGAPIDGAVIADGNVTVNAHSSNRAQSRGAAGGFGQTAGVAGVGIVNVVGNKTHADVDQATVLANALTVGAHDVQDIDLGSGSLGGGTFGAGGALNLVLLQSSVGAQINQSTVTSRSGNVSVLADSDRLIDSGAASVGVGGGGLGISVSVLVAGTGDISNDGKSDAGSSLKSGDQINTDNLSAVSDNDHLSDSQIKSYGSDDSQLSSTEVGNINAATGFNLNAATGTGGSAAFGASEGIQANITGSQVTSGGNILVDATTTTSTKNRAGTVAVGAIGVGGSVAYSSINSQIAAQSTSSTLTARNGVTISAQAKDGTSGAAASTAADAGVGGIVGIGAAVGISRIDNSVSANAGGSVIGTGSQDTLTIRASDTSTAKASNDFPSGGPSLTVGGVVAGAAVMRASRESNVSAGIAADSQITGFDFVNVAARSAGALIVSAKMGAGGAIAGGLGVDARADDQSTVTASLGARTQFSGTSAVNVSAEASPEVTSTAKGIVIGGGLSLGVNIAHADVDSTVNATVADGVKFGSGDVLVGATLTSKTTASASGGGGGLGISVNSGEAHARTLGNVGASVSGAAILSSGNLAIIADSKSLQNASADGKTISGLLAAGNVVSSATSGVTTRASFGDGNGVMHATRGIVSIRAQGEDTNNAESNAGTGALISGNGSYASTNATSTTSAALGKNQNFGQVAALELSAVHSTLYGGKANSTNASLVGGSGAEVSNVVNSTTATTVGQGTKVSAQGGRIGNAPFGGDISLLAESRIGATDKNGGTTGGSGGVISGQSATLKTDITTNNTVSTGQDVRLLSGGAHTDTGLNIVGNTGLAGRLSIKADTRVTGINDSSSLTVGGAISGAEAKTEFDGDFNNTINIGNNNLLNAGERVNIATYTRVDQVNTEALANTFGVLATVALARSKTDITTNQSIDIGSNTTIFSIGEADIIAGRDVANGISTQLAANSSAQAYARGLIAVPDAISVNNTTSNANLNLQSGARVISANDVGIGSVRGDAMGGSDGTGHGYELGFIPVTHSNSQRNQGGAATANINGQVLAGVYDHIRLSIDSNGNVTNDSGGVPVAWYVDKNLDQTLYLRRYMHTLDPNNNHDNDQFDGFGGNAQGGIFIGGSAITASDVGTGKALTPLAVSGGNVYLYGGAVNGSGSITAKGAPEIDINNASPHYLFLPSMYIPFGTSGQVILSGGAQFSSSDHIGGIAVTRTPATDEPKISVSSTYLPGNGHTPGIATLGDIDNRGGSVSLSTKGGSLLQLGSTYANSINMVAPQGSITLNSIANRYMGTTGQAGMLPGGWLWSFLSVYTNGSGVFTGADEIAAAIAQRTWFGDNDDWIGLNAQLYGGNRNTPWTHPRGSNWDDSATDRTPIFVYGFCQAFSSLPCNLGLNQNWAYINVGGDNEKRAPVVDANPLLTSGSFSNTPPSGSGYYAQQLNVVAGTGTGYPAGTTGFININAPIYVGTPATWTVQTTDALKEWQAQQTGSLPVPVPLYDVQGRPLLQLVAGNGNSRLIGSLPDRPVTYNPATQQLILPDVYATGNGVAKFDGKIVSTGQGSIRVSSGFGTVVVKNETGKVLETREILAGNGGDGLIEIKDRLTGMTTWYVSNNGQPAQIYQSTSANTWVGLNPVGAVDGNTSYAPKAGMQLQWGASTRVFRGSKYDLHWTNGTPGNGTNGTQWSLNEARFVDAGNDADLPGGRDYFAKLDGSFSDYAYGGTSYHGCDDDFGSECNYGTHATGHDGGGRRSLWMSIAPLQGMLTLSVKQRADKAIGIQFDTSNSSMVNIESNADVLLNGNIFNARGPTYITTTPSQGGTIGNITQLKHDGIVWTHELAMRAFAPGANIGSEYAPINVRIAHGATPSNAQIPGGVPSNAVIAVTSGGEVNLNLDSGVADQGLFVHAMGLASSAGNVRITNTGGIVGLSGFAGYGGAIANGIDITGNNIRLTSQQGSIGSLLNPLDIVARPNYAYNGAPVGGQLNALAYGDVAIAGHGGTMWLGGAPATGGQFGIESQFGDVYLESVNGGMLDARMLSSASTVDLTRAREIWAKLHLTDGNSSNAYAAALESRVDTAYMQYWQLNAAGALDGNGVFVFNTGAETPYFRLAALAGNIDPASVTDPAEQLRMAQTFAANRMQQVQQVFADNIGSNWQTDSAFTGGQMANYHFVLSQTVRDALASDATWTEGQLRQAISSVALATPTGGQVGAAPANITGNNVTLIARNGGIGRELSRLDVSYSDLYAGQLNAEQEGALALANAPGDAILLAADGSIIRTDDPRLDPQSASYDASLLNRISLGRQNPLYVNARGTLKGSASGTVYLQANDSMHLGGLSSGGDMRLSASNDIDLAAGLPSGTVALHAGRNATLVAGSGSISLNSSNPTEALPVQIDGMLLAASAGTHMLLKQMSGDLDFGTAFANNRVSLTSATGSLFGFLPTLSVVGHDIDLHAAGDIAGPMDATNTARTALKVQVASDGLIDATAGGDVKLDSPNFALHIGEIQAGNDIAVSAQNAGLDAVTLTSTGGAVSVIAAGDTDIGTINAHTGVDVSTTTTLTAGNIVSSTGNVNLDAVTGMQLGQVTALTGDIAAQVSGQSAPLSINTGLLAGGRIDAISSGNLTMASGSSVIAGDAIRMDAQGDVTMGLVQSGATQGVALTVQAGGNIDGNGAAVNLVARSGGTSVLDAQGHIGQQAQPIVVDVDQLTASSALSDIWLRTLGNISMPSITTPNGHIHVQGGGVVGFGQIAAQDSVVVTGTDLIGDSVTGTTALLQGTGAVDVNTLTTAGESTVVAGGAADITRATVGGNLSLHSGTDANLGTASVAGTGQVDAGQSLTVGTYTGGDSLQATSGTDTTVGQIALTAGNLGIDAGQNLSANTLNASVGTITLHAGQAADVQALNAGGTLLLNTGTNANLGTAAVGGTGQINAGQSLTVGTYTGGDSLQATSGTDTTVGQIALTAGNLGIDAGQNMRANSLSARAGAITLDAGQAADVRALDASGNVLATAGTRLDAGQWLAGGNADLLARDAIQFGNVTAGQNLTGTSTLGSIAGTEAHAGVDLTLNAATTLDVLTLTAGRDTRLTAGGALTTGTLTSGNDAVVRAGGDIRMNSTTVGNVLDVDGGAALTIGDATAGHRVKLAAQTIDFGTIRAPDVIDLHARNGNIIGAELATRDAYIAARHDIALDAVRIGNRLNMQANTITANLFQTSTQDTIYSVLTGYQGGVAKTVQVRAQIPKHWQIDQLSAVDATLATTGPDVSIDDGHIENTMALDTQLAKIRMNQFDPTLVAANIQLMEPDFNFNYYQRGIHTLTDAYMIRYQFGNQVQTPNYVVGHFSIPADYLGESVLRYNGRKLSEREGLLFDEDGNLIPLDWESKDMQLITPSPEGTLNLSLAD
ncbi:leukotoxin LktA family filamentous adhesin [Lysobacter sp. HDW10]|nr:leukotoxin LktA family filamentous adhesin [Lysobacter sp. HDW10]